MSFSAHNSEPRVQSVETNDDELLVDLVDGRKLIVPLAWFPKLLHATPEHRSNWELLGDGEGIHWPDVDEDLSAAGLLNGTPAPGTADRQPAS